MKDDKEKKVRYVCDMRACEDCSYPECEYTTDVAHAMHFYNDGGGYVEVGGTFDMTPTSISASRSATSLEWTSRTLAYSMPCSD